MGRVEEIDHTADLAIRVEAESLADLFATAVRGMFALIGSVPPDSRPAQSREIQIDGDDDVARLRDLLRQALALFDLQGCFVTDVEVRGLHASLTAVPFDPVSDDFRTEIKGVTWHGLRVGERGGLWSAEIVFDV